ncbi:septal ring lytic transglycosylase RlpA family protein [Methylobacterium nonmethylotrophicum]|uniref:Endolytic peptidoglycan transglycosylase RlpA n=2 Tax=Methylobacterium nonmethylotrophicum TaxID=1141884 RepID=A0A4Z0NN92_9HYPH|nr:septal ring lytic transglycosylase RlpA family protein [Methylobacterium nonmethylotrophicum]TGD97952.1 septal ring lytic transglycosylase RlpA family protein [Methylobacterium nonmethylotrophicum]
MPVVRWAAVAGIALAAANCAGPTPKQLAVRSTVREIDPKYGVAASPRLYGENDKIPKGGGRQMTGKPYVVAGRTYVPRQDARGYVREGLASWYGTAFHGRQTANGEVFDRFSVAAAHPTLPLPSYARVTNLANGHSMVVRVNDRGPYHADRLMDVSQAVAEALDFRRRGTTRVRVEYVGKASVGGSDDRKLMATLRTDGTPAGSPAGANIMVAEASEEAREEPRAFAFRRPEPEPVRPIVERPRVAAPVRIAEVEPEVLRRDVAPAPARMQARLAEAPRAPARLQAQAPTRMAAIEGLNPALAAPRAARPAPAPAAAHRPAPPSQALAFAAHRPQAPDRASLAQVMQAAAQPAGARGGAKDGTRSGPLPIAPPLRLASAQRARDDAKEQGHRPGQPPRSKVAGMY